MTIEGIHNVGDYTGTIGVPRAKANLPAAPSVSLGTDSINFALSGDADNVKASNYLSLFSVLNANIQDSNNLSGVGSAIDTYTSSLASSNVYDSSYTAPTPQFLADLAKLKTAAASGSREESEFVLTAAKLDAPDSVAGGIATAASNGDTAGEANLLVEGTANINSFLAGHGYSSKAAVTEAAAIIINGLTESAADTPVSSAQTRLRQITDLAAYAANNQEQHPNGASATSSDPLFNVISALLEAKPGASISRTLTYLEGVYNVSSSKQAEL